MCLGIYHELHVREYNTPSPDVKKCLPLKDNYEGEPEVHPTDSYLGDLKVYDILGACKVRIGAHGDGGYNVIDLGLDNIEEVFSFGVAEDIMFEYDLKKRYP